MWVTARPDHTRIAAIRQALCRKWKIRRKPPVRLFDTLTGALWRGVCHVKVSTPKQRNNRERNDLMGPGGRFGAGSWLGSRVHRDSPPTAVRLRWRAPGLIEHDGELYVSKYDAQ